MTGTFLHMNAEQLRLEASNKRAEQWDLWGPYLAERAWGTVREDYSADGEAWIIFRMTIPDHEPIVGAKTA